MNAKPTNLEGGNMNSPIRIGETVYKEMTESSDTVQKLLLHLEKKGIDWTPKYLGTSKDEKEMLSFIEGEVPHDYPEWLWEEEILVQVAESIRKLHDATVDFSAEHEVWALPPSNPIETICHNDFAPYNTVFKDGKFVGLIDFDVCSPGSRLRDISYAIYRFVPFMPAEKGISNDDFCHFDIKEMERRIHLFLTCYSGSDSKFLYSLDDLCKTLSKRLISLADRTKDYSIKMNSYELLLNSDMYERHATWIGKYFN